MPLKTYRLVVGMGVDEEAKVVGLKYDEEIPDGIFQFEELLAKYGYAEGLARRYHVVKTVVKVRGKGSSIREREIAACLTALSGISRAA